MIKSFKNAIIELICLIFIVVLHVLLIILFIVDCFAILLNDLIESIKSQYEKFIN
jgi:hypothetical protein